MALKFQSCLSLIQSSPKYLSTFSLLLLSALQLSTNSPSTALGYTLSIQMIFPSQSQLQSDNGGSSTCATEDLFIKQATLLARNVRSFRVAWQGGKAQKSTYLFSLFCFLVNLLNQREYYSKLMLSRQFQACLFIYFFDKKISHAQKNFTPRSLCTGKKLLPLLFNDLIFVLLADFCFVS